ncbi:uncharacterized protein LOC111020057 [Momordica charantia]|uniref:Uncharacterized protein LOC111020057 n=1 Tax=Momordica charantia TaxID=3673 RepID=A0A6J1DFN2_MOMCH|nr:uncharacterized protein LOC111020057 [Momordica charantia]
MDDYLLYRENESEEGWSDQLEDDQVTLLAVHRRGDRRPGHRLDRGRGRGIQHNYQRRAPREEAQVDRNLGSIKLKIQKFFGKTDPEEYLQWENEVESVFVCHNFSEEKKIQLFVARFKQYAQTWWDKLMSRRRRNLEAPIVSWYEFNESLKERFVPKHFERDMAQKLQALRQGNKSVEDYYKEIDTLMDRIDLDEDMKQLMARFLNDLNKEIADKVDLQPYFDIEEMLHLAIKIERQIQRKSQRYSSKQFSNSSATWKKDSKNSDVYPGNGEENEKPKSKIEKGESSMKGKEKVDEHKERTRDIKCWKCHGVGHVSRDCPNKRTMIIKNGEVVTKGEESENEERKGDIVYSEESSDGSYEEPVVGDVLVSRRALNTLIKEDLVEEQRETLFHTRCHVNGKACSVMIDGGSCTNVVNTLLIKRLGLPTTAHPRPYKLQLLNNCGEVRVNRQCIVPFSIGRYKDDVLCDVAPMHAGEILLEKPWQFDRKTVHDGYLNHYKFTKDGRKIILLPLSTKDVFEEQCKLEKMRVEAE